MLSRQQFQGFQGDPDAGADFAQDEFERRSERNQVVQTHEYEGGPRIGGGLRPERLSGEQMDQISPGWTAERLERAQRSDGGNG